MIGINEQNLSKNAQSIQKILDNSSLEFKVIELSESTRTAEDAANSIGCTIAQIVKSLVFRTKQSHKPILVLASGANRVNEKTLASLVGEKIEKADATFTREVTGFAIGGIPPVGHTQPLETFIDKDLLSFKEVWAAAGTPNAVFRLDPATLLNLTHGSIVSIA